jgi:hypothetical protein
MATVLDPPPINAGLSCVPIMFDAPSCVIVMVELSPDCSMYISLAHAVDASIANPINAFFKVLVIIFVLQLS